MNVFLTIRLLGRCRTLPTNLQMFRGADCGELAISILLFAATDTTSHLMAQVVQLLAEHPDIQGKVREEILASRDGQDIAYDQLHALRYLDAVCKETLRLCVH